MKNYADFYAKITDPIRKNPRAVHSLRLINRLLTAVMYLVYPLLLIYLFSNSKANLSQLSLSSECRLSLYP